MNKFEKVFHSVEELEDFGVVNLHNSFTSVVEDIDLDKYLLHFGNFGELFSDLLEGVDSVCNNKEASNLFSSSVLYNLSKNIVKRCSMIDTEINKMFNGGDRYLKISFSKCNVTRLNYILIELKLMSFNKDMTINRESSFFIYLKSKKEIRNAMNRIDNSYLSTSAKRYLRNLFDTCYPFELDYDSVMSSIRNKVSNKIDEFMVDVEVDNIYSIYTGVRTFLIASFRYDRVLRHFINDIRLSVSDDCVVIFFNEKEMKSIQKVAYVRCLEEVL
ncbi:hypothetical protein ACEE21_14755 [Clostridium baratii]